MRTRSTRTTPCPRRSLLLAGIAAGTMLQAQYCVPTGAANNPDEIRRFTLANLDNASEASEGTNGYANYTDSIPPADLEAGASYVASLTSGSGTGSHGAAIWIDYNDNDTFEASEMVTSTASSISPSTTVSFPPFTVPITPGIHRLRVQYTWNQNGANLDPCSINTSLPQYAENEDYLVSITLPSCFMPVGLAVDDLSATGADFSWSAGPSAPASGYQWEIRQDGTVVDGGTTGDTNAGSTALSPNAAYGLYVRGDCGDGDLSSWTGPVTFYTLCAPQDVPYTENFEEVTVPALPNCMTNQTITGPAWVSYATPPAGMTGKAARCYERAEVDSWLFTNGLNLTGGTSYRLSYKYSNAYSTYVDALLVAWGSSPGASAMNHILIDHPSIEDGLVHEDVLDFTPLTSGVYYIGFQKYSNENTDDAYMYIDDIKVIATPSCEEPTEMEVTAISTTSADFSWVASSSNPGNGYQWEVRTDGDPGDPDPVAGGTIAAGITTAQATDLEANTSYQLYLRSDCGDGDLSTWAGPITIYTGHCIPSGAANNTDEIRRFTLADLDNSSAPSEGTDGYMDYTGTVAPANLEAASAYVASLTSGSGTLSHGAAIWIDYNDNMIFEESEKVASIASTIQPSSTVSFPAFTVEPSGGTHRLRVQYRYNVAGANLDPCVTGQYAETEDYLVSITIPSCYPPMNLTVAELSATGATFTWVAAPLGAANEYLWEVRQGGTVIDSGTSSNTGATATALEPNTAYSLYVRGDCGDGGLSNWAVPLNFATPCTATDVPYLEDFNAVAIPALPSCMGIETVSGNPWTTKAAVGTMVGNAANVSYTPGGSPDMESWLFTQGLNLTGGTTYRLTYDFFNNSTAYTERMAVSYGTSPSATSMANALADHDSIRTTTVQTNTVDFTPDATGIHYIGFKCHSIANQNQLYLDDIHVYELQACAGMPDPGATTGPAAVCADTPFTLGMENNPGTTAGYTYQWETSTDNSMWANAPGAGTAATYSASQTAATWYRVQMTCADGGTAASTPVLVGMNAPAACYCTSYAITYDIEPICNVTFAGINHDSPSNIDGSPALEDFTAFTAQVQQGGSYTISATGNTNGSYTCHFTAFFDWDGNGTLETAVPIGSINSDVCTQAATTTVNVPADAVIGTTHMRVVKNFSASPTNPCGTYGFGQAEDYSVEVSPAAEVEDCLGVVGGPALPGTPCTGTNGYGGLWSNSCVCIENVGIGETAAAAGIAVHPNPASTELFITTPDGRPVHAKVFDMVGKLALEKDQTTRMDVANLAPGSYSLLIMDAQGNIQARTRFMKQ